MYRHILVPIDHTDLSTVTIGQAVEFARHLGARIMFFHAQANHATSYWGEAEMVRITAPEDYFYTYQGQAQELLTKAESAARAQGVPCAALTTMSNSPYAAIVDAAQQAGCDLIFMASHGRRSAITMALASQTLKVLLHSEVPVLVSATKNPPPPAQALATMRDEHRSLAAVLHAALHTVKSAVAANVDMDHALLRSIVLYLREFPVALHHPKEEQYLFRRLRERCEELIPELDELQRQHIRDVRYVEELDEQVERYIDGSSNAVALLDVLSGYAKFMWEHMGREEGVVLPTAQRCLTAADWEEINQAFAENHDSRFSGELEAKYRHLFSLIVNQAPGDK